MQTHLIQNSIATCKLQLGTQQKISYYFPISIGIIFPLTGLYIILESYLKNEHIPQRILNPWIWTISILLVIVIYWLQHKRLKLRTIETSLNPDEALSVFRKAIENLNWKTTTNNKKVIVAKVNNGWLSGSWGEQVTIIFDGNKIYLNSICDPDKKSSLISYGNNKKNIGRLLLEIKKTAKEKDLLLTNS